MKPTAKKFIVTLEKKETLTVNITAFYFRKPQEFTFLPGQYMQLTLPHEKADDRGTNRFFTIASAPEEKFLMITTRTSWPVPNKNDKSSFKHALFQLKIGAEIACFGPIGTFVLDEASLRI